MIQSGLVRRLGTSLRLVIIGSFLLVGLLGFLFVLIVQAADERSRTLLATELDRAAGTVSDALRPVLRTATPGDVMLIAGALESYASSDRVLGLYFTPAQGTGVYFIAGAPGPTFAQAEGEAARLLNGGAFGDVSSACAPVRVDTSAIAETALWAVVPISGATGCWRLIANRTLVSAGPTFLASPEVRSVSIAAAAVALLMIAAALLALTQVRRLRHIVDVGLAYAEIAAVDDDAVLPQPANDETKPPPAKAKDVASAQILDLKRATVDLSAAVRTFAETAQARLGAQATLLTSQVENGVFIDGRPDFVRTILDDLVAPALTAPSGPIVIVLAADEVDDRRHAVLTVTTPRTGGDVMGRLSLIKQFIAALGAAVTMDVDAEGAETVLLRFPWARSVTQRQTDVG